MDNQEGHITNFEQPAFAQRIKDKLVDNLWVRVQDGNSSEGRPCTIILSEYINGWQKKVLITRRDVGIIEYDRALAHYKDLLSRVQSLKDILGQDDYERIGDDKVLYDEKYDVIVLNVG